MLDLWFGDGSNERYSSAWFTAPNSIARARIDGLVRERFGGLVNVPAASRPRFLLRLEMSSWEALEGNYNTRTPLKESSRRPGASTGQAGGSWHRKKLGETRTQSIAKLYRARVREV